ncbi:MAG: TM2 domain-containing protein [Bacteroidales bacterium]|nr:TM2 domain-containing protein [Bacteroidales bacterium]
MQYGRGVFDNGPSGKSRGVAGLLAILLGSLGIHYFYLGKNTAGIIFLLVTLLSCGVLGTVVAILSLISGVLMLTATEEDFENKYVYSNNTMPI